MSTPDNRTQGEYADIFAQHPNLFSSTEQKSSPVNEIYRRLPKRLKLGIAMVALTLIPLLAGCATPQTGVVVAKEVTPIVTPLVVPEKTPVIEATLPVSPTVLLPVTEVPTKAPTEAPKVTEVPTEPSKPTIVPTVKPAEAPTVVKPITLEQWIVSARPDLDTNKILSPYAKAMGISVESIKTQTQILSGVNGTFAVVYDQAGTPLLISVKESNGEFKWQEATLGRLSSQLGIAFGNTIRLVSEGKNPNYPNDAINKVVSAEFGLAVLDEHFKFYYLQPDQGKFSYGLAEQELSIARNAGMKTRGQALIYGRSDWKWSKWLKTLPQDQLEQTLRTHVTTVVNKFKGRINEWVVDNEYGLEDDELARRLPNYFLIAFEAAEKADPNAVLIHNVPISNLDVVNQTAKDQFNSIPAKNKRLGIQLHMNGSAAINKDKMIATLRAYGVPIEITELDVNMKDVSDSPEVREQKQAEYLQIVIDAIIESGVCTGINFWETGDKNSWLEATDRGPGRYSPNADGTLYHDDLSPKQALFAVKQSVLNALLKRQGK